MTIASLDPTRTAAVARDWLFVDRKPRVDRIIAEVANRHGLTAADLIAGAFKKKLAPARQEAMYALRRYTSLSTPQIARRLGLEHHTTVIYGADRHADRSGLPRVSRVRA